MNMQLLYKAEKMLLCREGHDCISLLLDYFVKQ